MKPVSPAVAILITIAFMVVMVAVAMSVKAAN
jgi:hypothetical protein